MLTLKPGNFHFGQLQLFVVGQLAGLEFLLCLILQSVDMQTLLLNQSRDLIAMFRLQRGQLSFTETIIIAVPAGVYG